MMMVTKKKMMMMLMMVVYSDDKESDDDDDDNGIFYISAISVVHAGQNSIQPIKELTAFFLGCMIQPP